MSLSAVAVTFCIKESARYLRESSVLNQGIIPGRVLRFDPGFIPSREWVDSARALFFALSSRLASLLTEQADSYSYLVDFNDWAHAYAEDHSQRGGWDHRIILAMTYLRRANGDGNLGDYEFDLVHRAIRGQE